MQLTGLRRGLGAGLVVACGAMSAWAQVGPADTPSDQLGPVSVVPFPREIAKAFQDAQQQLEQRQYPEAVGLLQSLLEAPEDYLLGPVVGTRWTSSVKQRALAMLRSLPAEGRQVYQVQYEAQAAQLWDRYQATADPAWPLAITRRYPTTSSSSSALSTLATVAFDRSEPLIAARWWDDLAAQDATMPHGLERTIAWSVAGRQSRARELLAELTNGPQPSWQLAGERVSRETVANTFAEWMAARFPDAGRSSMRPVADWTMFRGDAARNAVASPAGPIGGPRWTVDTVAMNPSLAALMADQPAPATTEWSEVVALIERRLNLDEKVKLPGFHPLVIGDTAVVRTADGLVAVDVPTGQIRWRTPVSFSQLAQLDPLPDDATEEQRERWLYLQAVVLHQRLYRDQTTGTLASDGEWVYAVEASPIADSVDPLRGLQTVPTVANKLTAYDLRTGKLMWELGGRRTEAGGPFDGYFFQGPPLVVGDRLYVIAEINSEQRLLEFRREPTGVTLEWTQVIAAPQSPPLGWAMQRRLGGHSPSLAADILICPTSAGLVVAVDPVRRMLLWGYRYATHRVPSPEQRFAPFGGLLVNDPRPIFDEDDGYWQDAAPAISTTQVVLTPRDSMELHVLDLLTGELAWKQPREDGLYVAGIDGPQVLVVGRQTISARNLADGALVWEQPIPLPVGRGLLQTGRYLLPVESGEVLAVDSATGRIAARAKLPAGRTAGNLAAARGVLVSQSVQELTAFRSLTDIERQITDTLSARPEDAEMLGLRGEVRLFQGDEAAGIADLRRSLAAKPDRHVSRILAGVLIDGLKRDFGRYQSLIEEIDRVTVDPELRAEFLQLVADGLERQGNRVAAFGQYLKLMGLADRSMELVRADAALAARTDRIVRGKAWGTYQAATSTERSQIDLMLRQNLEQAPPGSDGLERDARFLQFFEGHPLTDVVRRRLIDRLPPDRQPERLHQLRQLADSRAAASSAYAAVQLARWHLDRNEFSAARPWLAKLTAESRGESLAGLGDVATLLQKWSAEFGDRWHLEPPAWPTGAIEPERRAAVDPSLRRIARMEVVGPVGPDYHGWSFELHDDGTLAVVARDTAGRQQWSVPLPDDAQQLIPRGVPLAASPRLFCAGTTLAISFATAFAVLDTPVGSRTPKVLWSRSLAPSEGRPNSGLELILPEMLATGRRRVYAGDRQHEQPFGQLLGLTHDQLVYHLGTRIFAVDPHTGQTVWTRNDAPRRAEGTVDADVVVVFDTERDQAQVLRAWDGVELARRPLSDPHDWLWFQGNRLLTLRVRRNELLAEFQELSSGRTVWKQALSLTSRAFVLDNREVVCLDPQGRLMAIALETGQVLWERPTVAVERLGYLWAAKEAGRYTVVAGNPAPIQPDVGQIRTYDGTQIAFSGVAFQVDPAKPGVLWQVDIPATAFEPTQPATAPLLAFVGKVVPPPEKPNGVFQSAAQLSATFIDRRDGTVVYQTTESQAPRWFDWEPSGEHQQLTANFASWLIEFTVRDDRVESAR